MSCSLSEMLARQDARPGVELLGEQATNQSRVGWVSETICLLSVDRHTKSVTLQKLLSQSEFDTQSLFRYRGKDALGG